MCHRVTCGKCGKPSWVGCGFHVETALAGVPLDERCKCKGMFATALGAIGLGSKDK